LMLDQPGRRRCDEEHRGTMIAVSLLLRLCSSCSYTRELMLWAPTPSPEPVGRRRCPPVFRANGSGHGRSRPLSGRAFSVFPPPRRLGGGRLTITLDEPNPPRAGRPELSAVAAVRDPPGKRRNGHFYHPQGSAVLRNEVTIEFRDAGGGPVYCRHGEIRPWIMTCQHGHSFRTRSRPRHTGPVSRHQSSLT